MGSILKAAAWIWLGNDNSWDIFCDDKSALIMNWSACTEISKILQNIVLNSAAGLVISGKAKKFKEAINMVNYNIDNGHVINKLKSLIDSNE